MFDTAFIVQMAVAAIAMGTTAWTYVKDRRLQSALRAIQRTEIARTPEGQRVKIEGLVKPVGPPLTAPISGRPCVAYDLSIEGVMLRPVRDVGSQGFAIEDDTGVAWIRGPTSIGFVPAELRDILQDDERLESYLARRGIRARGRVFERIIRYREAILEEGARVTVVGVGHWESDSRAPFAGYREPLRRLALDAAERTPTIVLVAR